MTSKPAAPEDDDASLAAGESPPPLNVCREDSLAAARETAFLRPDDARAQAGFGRAALAAGRLAEAIEALQRALRLDPDDAAARVDLGRAWLAAAEPDKALVHLRRAVTQDSEHSSDARALLAARESGNQDLTPAFVRTLFDQYADRYDAEMTGVLAYRAPEALRDLAIRAGVTPLGVHSHVMPVGMRSHDAPEGGLDVLDLGCGTGLSGQAFRVFARSLVGVDLSPGMAAKARARGRISARNTCCAPTGARALYDRVVVGDMIQAMRAAPASFDLVIAVDALGYVGDLAPVFHAARGALRNPGYFAATVECAPGGATVERAPGGATVEENAVVRSARASPRSADFDLGPARRFRHGAAYVRRAAAAAGFDVLALEKTELRRDRGIPVAGLLFVLAAAKLISSRQARRPPLV